MAENKSVRDILFEDLSDIYDEIERSEVQKTDEPVCDTGEETLKKEKESPAEQSGKSVIEKKHKKFPWKSVLFSLLGLAFAGAAGAYAYGVSYYGSHFLPNTAAEGVLIENLTADEADALLTKSKLPEDRSFTLTAMDGEKITFDTLPLSIERHYEGIGEALSAQNRWAFFLNIKEPKQLDFDYSVTFEREGIDTALSALSICDPEKSEPPVDSYVYQDGNTGEFLISAPVDGNTIDTVILSDAIAKAVSELRPELDIASAGAYITASIREDDESLNKKADTENRIEAVDISIVIDEGTVEKMTPEQFRGMIAEDPESCTPENIIDMEKFRKYVDRIARMYTTKSGSGYRYFKSVTGERKAMQTDYGWDMDEEALSEALLPAVAEVAYGIFVDETVRYSNPEHTVRAVWSQTAESHGERDTGESWVEVDLTNQHVFVVVDGELKVECDCVTGLDRNAGRRTPTGFYKISFKTTERDLVGLNPDGSESYRSHVHYWMPFNKNIGLHDATWRSKFGGTIYKNDGSHGCVNLPLAKAKEIYGYVYKGMPVIVYK